MAGPVEDGRPFNEHELLGAGSLRLAGGLDTVPGLIGFIMPHLAPYADTGGSSPQAPSSFPTRSKN